MFALLICCWCFKTFFIHLTLAFVLQSSGMIAFFTEFLLPVYGFASLVEFAHNIASAMLLFLWMGVWGRGVSSCCSFSSFFYLERVFYFRSEKYTYDCYLVYALILLLFQNVAFIRLTCKTSVQFVLELQVWLNKRNFHCSEIWHVFMGRKFLCSVYL